MPNASDDASPEPEGQPLLRGEVAFRLLVESVEDYAIFLLGPDGRVLTWNLGAQRIKGYTADEIIGRHFSAFYTPEEREAGRPRSLLAWAAEYGRFEDEGWRVRKDGSRFWADVVLTALRDDAGEPYAFAKVTRDMTARRAAEDQERKLHAERQARAAAEEALKARDRFLSIASHELKTPVASLQLATESLARLRSHGRLDDARLETGLGRLSRATTRLGVLVNELLDVSRLTAEHVPFDPTPVDVVPLAREIVERFADIAEDRQIFLRGAPEAWVLGDGPRLDQVLTNLVDNAVKFSQDGDPVEIEVHDDGRRVQISVADVGIGLDDEPNPRIFEAFGRGEKTEHIQGLGLGLYISRQIVERHGGEIEAKRRSSGPGTIFTVWLPRPGDAPG